MRLIIFVLAFAYMIYAFLADHSNHQCDNDCEFCPFPPCDDPVHKKKDL